MKTPRVNIFFILLVDYCIIFKETKFCFQNQQRIYEKFQMPRIKLASRVSTGAGRFDRTCNSGKDRWSYGTFAGNWRDGRVC